jgi:hypothetical protein
MRVATGKLHVRAAKMTGFSDSRMHVIALWYMRNNEKVVGST